ncbi:UPF0696 protein C11orf68 homolog [Glandiceps talaboti]
MATYMDDDEDRMDEDQDVPMSEDVQTESNLHKFSSSNYHSDTRPLMAEDYAAQSLAADMDEWITYDHKADNPEASFQEFIINNKPSTVSRLSGVGWIFVESPSRQISEDETGDVIGLQEQWELLQNSGRPINYHTIFDLAKAHDVLNGKWLMHMDPGFKTDHAWEMVAKATVQGQLGCSAKVSPFDPTKPYSRHVICVYNNDFTDKQAVYELEDKIRSVGIKCHLSYKPDVYTYLGIYRNNKWQIRPTIYESIYTLHKGSRIDPLYE